MMIYVIRINPELYDTLIQAVSVPEDQVRLFVNAVETVFNTSEFFISKVFSYKDHALHTAFEYSKEIYSKVEKYVSEILDLTSSEYKYLSENLDLLIVDTIYRYEVVTP